MLRVYSMEQHTATPCAILTNKAPEVKSRCSVHNGLAVRYLNVLVTSLSLKTFNLFKAQVFAASCYSPSWCNVRKKPSKIFLTFTWVVLDLVEKADGVKVLGCGHWQCQNIPNGLVESRVGAVTERDGLILILEEILHMTHFVMHCNQVIHVHHCALLNPGKAKKKLHGRSRPSTHSACKLCTWPYFIRSCTFLTSLLQGIPEVFAVVEVPGWGMTHHFTVCRLRQHWLVPEFKRHSFQAQWCEEVVRLLEHFQSIPALRRSKQNGHWVQVELIRWSLGDLNLILFLMLIIILSNRPSLPCKTSVHLFISPVSALSWSGPSLGAQIAILF